MGTLEELVRRIVKEELDARSARFRHPTLDEVAAYCAERRNAVDPEAFVNHYTANGWRVGKTAMKDWRAAVRTWEGKGSRNVSTKFNPAAASRAIAEGFAKGGNGSSVPKTSSELRPQMGLDVS